MNTKRLHLVLLMLAIVGQQVCSGQNKPPVQANGAPAEAKLDPQLEVNRDALLGGSLAAADVMLFNEDPNARQILLETLEQSENSPARIVVCRALIKAREDKEVIENVQEFIDPLLVVFGSENANEARLAAEATLIFDYEQISESFEKLLEDGSEPVRAKANTVRALKLRSSDMNATIKLITLVDHPDKQVSAEARKALESLGMEVGENAEAREELRKRIKLQGLESFLRDRVIHLEREKRAVMAELEDLEKLYLVLLDTAYKGKSDDADKGKFLAEHLGGSKASVKLWALEEVDQWRKGTENPTFPREQLEPILISLISDPDRNVRLRTADLLARMVELNSAKALLSQLEVEQDDQVKTELFVALGWVCWSTISSTEAGKIPPETKEIRAQTLKWAEKFLSEEGDAEKARIGAEVVEKLLKRDGLEKNEAKRYLDLLLARYEKIKNESDGTLRGDLLNAMAGLCGQNSTCKDQAASLYKSLFEKALLDDTAFVRETAVDGLANIDKTKALEILRDRYVNDPSVILRKKIIALADAVGDKRDLTWLAEKIGVNSESKPAWQAMRKIFSGSDTQTINEWVEKLTAESSKSKLTDVQKIDFLVWVSERISGENKPQMLKDVRERLVVLYRKTGQYAKAEEYLDKMRAAATTPEERNAVIADLIGVYFDWRKTDLVAKLLAAALQKEDLDTDGTLLKTLDKHLTKPSEGVDPKEVLAQLAAIKTPKERPKWGKWLQDWQTRLSKSEQPADKPQAENK